MPPHAREHTCDVLVIGGGPAGSTIAALLASDGLDVAVMEKDRHPRFHIGESLLPMNMPLLEKLGVMDEVRAIGMPKFGIEFVSPWHSHVQEFQFATAWDKSNPSAFQVRRSEFDHILLKNAAAKGARVHEGTRVTDVTFLGDEGVRVTAQTAPGEETAWRAKFLVDASGRDTFLANRLRIKRSNLRNNSAAVFGHFTHARRLEGKAEGHISIFWFDYGWIWFIPLADGTTSIGAVGRHDYMNSRKGDITQFLLDTLKLSPALMERLENAELTGPATATGNYSYFADRMYGDNYIMIGDAYSFIDPVFSTGVFLAMNGAFLGAEVVKTSLVAPALAHAARLEFDAQTRRALQVFSWYIYRISRPAFRELFMAPSNIMRIEEAMMSLLSGDVFRPTPIFSRLLLFKGLYYLGAMKNKLRGREPWLRPRMAVAGK